jgi:23S rRNA (uracil1939-C5)-methyltransferase
MQEVTIIDYDHQGRGMARINNKICFIPNTMIDEIVKVNITKEKKNFMEAEVVEYIKTNPNRKDNICPYYTTCGGCDILHLEYEEQLKYKYNKVVNIIKRYVNEDIKINNIISDKQFNYRNKVTLQVEKNKVGFYSKKSNTITPIKECKLLDESLNNYIKTITNTSEKIVLRTNGKDVLDNYQDRIIKYIGDKKYEVSLESFFQVNDNVTYKMYEKVKEYVNSNNEDYVLDLYCGTGTIGIYLADTSKEVLGIEINKQAIKDANRNKEINNLNNIKFIADDVAKVINKIEFKPTIVVVDPPRAGLDEKTIKEIVKMNPKRLVYVSCDPMTFARDLNILKYYFNIKEITPFDMFPNTYHVENVCLLERK